VVLGKVVAGVESSSERVDERSCRDPFICASRSEEVLLRDCIRA
jgi:hypothetical protein